MGNSYINKEYLKKIPIAIFLLFICTTFLIPVRRDIQDNGSTNPVIGWIFEFHIWIPLLVAVFVAIRSNSPSLNRIANIDFWNWVAAVVVIVFLILIPTKVPGLWWTWITLGVHLSTIMLVANCVRSKLKDLHALTLGLAVASFAAGSWEAIYQLAYYQHYDVPQSVDITHIQRQLIRISPLAITGLGVMLAYGRLKFQRVSIILFGLTGLTLFIWIYGEMWVDIYFNWSKGLWEYTSKFNYSEALLYRSSKATLALGLVSLYSRSIRLKKLLGYSIIIPWSAVFIATTIFLGVTWVKSLFAKEGKPPYFKTRSIHYDPQFDSPDGGGHQ